MGNLNIICYYVKKIIMSDLNIIFCCINKIFMSNLNIFHYFASDFAALPT